MPGDDVVMGLLGQPFPQDFTRYQYQDRPEIDWPGGNRPLNMQNLYDLGAFRLAQWQGNPGTMSMVSFFNDAAPDSATTAWPNVPREQAQQVLSSMGEWPLYTGKYNQLVDSARRLGILDQDIFLPQQGAQR